MKTPKEILEEQNISIKQLQSANDNGAELLENFGRLCMTHAIMSSAALATVLDDAEAILELIEKIKK